jgi:methionine--tRNA ligase beta chain
VVKSVIEYSDFEKLDFRVGRVVKAEAPEWSDKLLRFEVDFGEEVGKRIIFSGISKWYVPEDFEGKKFVFLVNMAVKKMGEEESQGMILLIDGEEKPLPLDRIEQVVEGEVVR